VKNVGMASACEGNLTILGLYSLVAMYYDHPVELSRNVLDSGHSWLQFRRMLKKILTYNKPSAKVEPAYYFQNESNKVWRGSELNRPKHVQVDQTSTYLFLGSSPKVSRQLSSLAECCRDSRTHDEIFKYRLNDCLRSFFRCALRSPRLNCCIPRSFRTTDHTAHLISTTLKQLVSSRIPGHLSRFIRSAGVTK